MENCLAGRHYYFGVGTLPAQHAAIETVEIFRAPVGAILKRNHPLAQRAKISSSELLNYEGFGESGGLSRTFLETGMTEGGDIASECLGEGRERSRLALERKPGGKRTRVSRRAARGPRRAALSRAGGSCGTPTRGFSPLGAGGGGRVWISKSF